MEWVSVKEKPYDENRICFLVEGDSIFMRGTKLQPFFIQLCGEMKAISSLEFTHWMPLPEPPKKELLLL